MVINPYVLDQFALADAKEDVTDEFMWAKPPGLHRNRRLAKLADEHKEEYLKLYARAYILHCEQVDDRCMRWLNI